MVRASSVQIKISTSSFKFQSSRLLPPPRLLPRHDVSASGELGHGVIKAVLQEVDHWSMGIMTIRVGLLASSSRHPPRKFLETMIFTPPQRIAVQRARPQCRQGGCARSGSLECMDQEYMRRSSFKLKTPTPQILGQRLLPRRNVSTSGERGHGVS
ncbi:hypothetical protein ARMSODRAFT_51309 [Armillaria solidipes]|uniref:Uncharacterized protein n=1 Tax=Armillaria solidipes TaxID=1076256 RepID=A0A2H3CHN9_9AGAR|nr:hypothetical protein ARMSODRAFT_51309 [Armillaria solidipes]